MNRFENSVKSFLTNFIDLPESILAAVRRSLCRRKEREYSINRDHRVLVPGKASSRIRDSIYLSFRLSTKKHCN